MNSRMFVRIGLLAMMLAFPFAGRMALAAPAVRMISSPTMAPKCCSASG